MSNESFTPEELLAKGREAEAKGSLKEAIRHYLDAAKKNPRLDSVYTALGNAYVKNKEPGKAIHSYKESIAITRNRDAYHNIGLLYYHLKMYGLAASHLREAERLGFKSAEVYYYLARSLFYDRQFEQAEKVLMKGYRETKQQKLLEMKRTLDAKKNALTAKFPGEEALLQLIDKRPHVLKNYNLLVIHYMGQNNIAKAEEILKRSVASNPESLPAATNLSAFYFNQYRFSDAVIVLEKASKITPGAVTNENLNILVNLAQGYLHVGEQKKAKKTLEGAIALNPPDVAMLRRMLDAVEKSPAEKAAESPKKKSV